MKFIVVAGVVIGKTRKGIFAAGIGAALKAQGLRVTAIKIDPHLNIDAGTLSPHKHGEVFVLEDGGEVDLDLGNYERFLDVTLRRDNNITTGKIYADVIDKERRGDYLGKTVQVVPHITDAIQDWIFRASKVPVDDSELEPDVCIIELGGMIGDVENMPFLEALKVLKSAVQPDNFCCVLVSLVSQIVEQKTHLTQNTAKQLQRSKLTPDLIICGCKEILNIKAKFHPVSDKQIISVPEDSSIYKVPILLEEQNVAGLLFDKLKLEFPVSKPVGILEKWKKLANMAVNLQPEVVICLVGNTSHEDAHASADQALGHAATACNEKLVIKHVEATDLEDETKRKNPVKYHEAWQVLCSADGILIPGDFGSRGLEGKILAAKWARESKKPFLGICLGMQCAVIECARNVLGLQDANASETDKDTPHPVVIEMSERSGELGGTTRLGKRRTKFVQESTLKRLYGDVDHIDERHRHRYEVNPRYVDRLEKAGLRFVGKDEEEKRMEILELKDHPYYVAVQYHPEYSSRPLKPSAPYLGLILAARGRLVEHLSREKNSSSDR